MLKLLWANFRYKQALRKVEKSYIKMLRDSDKKSRLLGLTLIELAAGSSQEHDRDSVTVGVIKELGRMTSNDPDTEVRNKAVETLKQIAL